MQTADGTRENIARMAAEGFAGHVIKLEGTQEWLCRNPSNSNRWFRVILRPYTLIVWGDIGDWIVSLGNPDGFGWLQRAAGNPQYPGYFLSKIRAGKEREFYSGDAWAWLQEEVATGNEDAIGVRDALDGGDFGREEWWEAWSETQVSHHDVPDFMDHGPGPLWLAQAMYWFVTHVDPAQAAA